MNENTPDGAEDLNRSQLRTALALGGRLGEILARQRAERKTQMLRAAAEEHRRLEERFEAERAVMRTELAAVHQRQFWESAAPEDVGERYAQARHWEPYDDLARLSRERMESEIRTRYDLSPQEYLAPASGAEGEQDRNADQGTGVRRAAEAELAEAERQSAAVARGDRQNDVDTQNAAAAAGELWDSGARREELAAALGDQFGRTPEGRDGAAAVLAADRDNGTPPAQAVQDTGHPVKGRRFTGPGRGKAQELGRG